MLTLVVLQGPDKGRRFELPDAPLLIGRDSRQLPLTDNTVSRRHCDLRLNERGEWVLRDLGSSNGTYVNGQRADRPVPLKLGDQMRVGRTLLVFGAQLGMVKAGAGVELMGEESGMDSSIINTLPSSDDSMVLAVPEPAVAAMSNLKVLYRLSAALGSSFKLEQICDVVMDLVFEHVQADRGILFLVDTREPEKVHPKVVRVRDETVKSRTDRGLKSGTHPSNQPATQAPTGTATTSIQASEALEKVQASRTIIQTVLRSGDGVLSSNAMADPRFRKGKSVHDMGIRSCLCVPIKVKKLDARATPTSSTPANATSATSSEQAAADRRAAEDVIGVIYIDSSVKNYTYSTDQLRLLTSIGLQAGLAIQNARLYQAGLEAERLAAIGETTAALSHSIKNILQALRGGADVVEIGLKHANLEQARKGWTVVDRNLEKILNLTLNLLAYSRPREPQIAMVNPATLINECIELIAPVCNERGAMAVADVDRNTPAVPMDADGMHQVIMNLLANSLDALRPNASGLIKVAARFDPDESECQIDITDNGVGIEASMMRHLFELFHSTKGNRGTGLGLAVAKKIVEEHGGSIAASSRPGEGATFSIRLPVYQLAGEPGSTHGPAVTEPRR
jgi:signal transduction histidine kinase